MELLQIAGSGGNFLRWSIYFLAGYDVIQNPLTKTNAHANGSHALDTTSKYNDWVSNLSTDKMNVAYITTFQDLNYENFHTKYHEETARHISKLQDYNYQDYIIVSDWRAKTIPLQEKIKEFLDVNLEVLKNIQTWMNTT